jgi:hypothetical protein
MTSRSSFIRKIVYLSAIAVLLIFLFWLSRPATPDSRGGVLARVRADAHLSQSEIGEVDPTSVTMKLATLGFRGVAANILWEKAIDYKMKKDWPNLGATLNQITKLQPNFINVWLNQSWNLSYNVSVAFDDYRERYRWVIKGFEFLKEGIKYNEKEPRLEWELGRMISQKIGKADEVKQYRRLFREDDDFNQGVPLAERDNWLIGKKWYLEAMKKVELGATLRGQSPLIYRSCASMCQMYYAEALETDGKFGEVAARAWGDAAADWHRYGDEEIATSFRDEATGEPIKIRLNDFEKEDKAAKDAIEKLNAMQPGLREKIANERRQKVSKNERAALETPPEKRTAAEAKLAAQAEEAIRVTYDDVARRIDQGASPAKPGKLTPAKQLVKQIAEHEQRARYIKTDRGTVNFIYWRQRADAEQTSEILRARELISAADKEAANNNLESANALYKQGFQAWRKALDKHPEYITDQTAGEDLVDAIRRYRRTLDQCDERFPQPFILQDVMDAQQKLYNVSSEVEGKMERKTEKVEKGKEEKPGKGGEALKTNAKKADAKKEPVKKDATPKAAAKKESK